MSKSVMTLLAAVAAGGAVSLAAASGASASPTADLFSSPRLDAGVYTSAQPVTLEEAQYVWGGRHYCWYDGGWHGPGFYWCGYAWRHGYGWGGGYGWRGWHGGGRHGGGYYGGRHYGEGHFEGGHGGEGHYGDQGRGAHDGGHDGGGDHHR